MMSFRRQGLLPAMLCALLALQGCGPQGGGTGTGDAVLTLSYFGALGTSSCSSGFAAALDCDLVLPTVTAATDLPGTADVHFVGGSGSARSWLQLRGNRAELELGCGGPRFVGDWGLRGDGLQAYFGQWRSADAAEPLPALLRVQGLPGEVLVIEAVDAGNGRSLSGALSLRRAQPPGC